MHLAIRLESREIMEVEKMKDARTRVLVIKDGIVKELDNLPEDIMRELEKEYEKTPIQGLSYDTYMALVEFFSKKLVAYQKELLDIHPGDLDMFAKTVAFARAFEISYDESPALFDMMIAVERGINERPDFTSKSISMKTLESIADLNWDSANKDFHQWARKLFEKTGMKIGIIRMLKFFYGILTQFHIPQMI